MKSISRLALVLFLAASPALAKDFISEAKPDVAGYFMPAKPVPRAGKFVLRNLSLGDAAAFRDFEAGKRGASYAPVMMEFDDVTSAKKQNELGQDYYLRNYRVLPTGYRVDGKTISFSGHDKTLGDVFFAGTLDRALLKKQKAAGPNGAAKAVLTGDLSFGGRMFHNVAFLYFAGE